MNLCVDSVRQRDFDLIQSPEKILVLSVMMQDGRRGSMKTPQEKGLEMESCVRVALEGLAKEFPTHFTYEYQPTIRTHLGNVYVPDFRLEVALPPFRLSFFVECQRRNRVGRDINEKIDSMRLRSQFNLFFFVYDGPLPFAKKQSMEESGTTCLSLAEFLTLLATLSRTLQVVRVASLPTNRLLRLGFFGV
jgi:hypothetical protein